MHEQLKEEIKKLQNEWLQLIKDYIGQFNDDGTMRKIINCNIIIKYNSLYTSSQKILRQILPERLNDFEILYKNKNRKDVILYSNFDIFLGLQCEFSHLDANRCIIKTQNLMVEQYAILSSVLDIIDNKIFNIKGEIEYNTFMNELEAASHLLKNNFVRAAGALAGVSLENHLKIVCQNHPEITVNQKDTLSVYNEKLKKAEIIEESIWRKIQYLSDIRNKCDHSKKTEPQKDEVQELIDGTKKIISTVN